VEDKLVREQCNRDTDQGLATGRRIMGIVGGHGGHAGEYLLGRVCREFM
jgi:hypothetical protein